MPCESVQRTTSLSHSPAVEYLLASAVQGTTRKIIDVTLSRTLLKKSVSYLATFTGL